MEGKGLVYKQISRVMAECGAIGKNRQNVAQKYKFRGIDDIYNALHDVLAKHKIFTVPIVTGERSEERQSKHGSNLIYRILDVEYKIFAEDGSCVTLGPVVGEGMDSGDKASNKAMSAAHKLAFLQLFCIATEENLDSETESHEVIEKRGSTSQNSNSGVTQKTKTTSKPSEVSPHYDKALELVKKVFDGELYTKEVYDDKVKWLDKNKTNEPGLMGAVNAMTEKLESSGVKSN